MQTATGAIYTVWLCNAFGERLIEIGDFLSLRLVRVVNNVGMLELTLPDRAEIRDRIVIPDGWVEVWRDAGEGARLLTNTYFHIQSRQRTISARGERTLTITAASSLFLLDEPGRIVDAASGTTQSTKAGAADDIIAAIVDEQLGSLASTQRQVRGVAFDVAQTGSQAPFVQKAFAWRTVLLVLQEIAATATVLGVYLAFDIVASGPRGLLFSIYLNQRGTDRRRSSSAPLILSVEDGMLTETTLIEDYQQEITASIVGGKGEGSGRLIGRYANTVRASRSPFRWREAFTQATQYEDVQSARLEAEGQTRRGRPRITIAAKIAETNGARFGRDWDFGDYLTVQAFGEYLDCRVDAIDLTVRNGDEAVNAELRGDLVRDDQESATWYVVAIPANANPATGRNFSYVYSSRTGIWTKRGTLPTVSTNDEWRQIEISPSNPRNWVLIYHRLPTEWSIYYSSDAGLTWTLAIDNTSNFLPNANQTERYRVHFISDSVWVWAVLDSTNGCLRFTGIGSSVTVDVIGTTDDRVMALPTGDVLITNIDNDTIVYQPFGQDERKTGATFAGTIAADAIQLPYADALPTGEIVIRFGGGITATYLKAEDYRDTDEAYATITQSQGTTSASVALARQGNAGKVTVVRSDPTASDVVIDLFGTPSETQTIAAFATKADAQTRTTLLIASDSAIRVRTVDGTLVTVPLPENDTLTVAADNGQQAIAILVTSEIIV